MSVLSADQEEACRTFARKGVDRFATLPWSMSPAGQPILDEAIAWFDCTVANLFPCGDHDIVIGEVTAVWEGDVDRGPLVVHRGMYTKLG